ncbi:MAG: DinB family protein [Verrucomicrobia bacterium]|nr:DinB family protein [Cytophagales bacterium]
MQITRKNALKALLASFLSLPVFGESSEKKDLKIFKEEFFSAWQRSEIYTLTVFNQMPEEYFDFRYTPEAFSFRTQFVHCITFTAAQLSGRFAVKNPYEEKKKEYWSKLSKKEIEAEISGFYAWVKAFVSEAKSDWLTAKEDFAGGKIPKWRFLYAMENHIIHHRGQAIVYLRLKGIIPEGYIGW